MSNFTNFFKNGGESTEAFERILRTFVYEARQSVEAHQAAIDFLPDGDWNSAVRVTDWTSKYSQYNTFDKHPTGKGLYTLMSHDGKSVCFTDEELKGHPAWNNFSNVVSSDGQEHPPLRGLVGVPVRTSRDELCGLVMASDKVHGQDFTDQDMDALRLVAGTLGPIFEMHLHAIRSSRPSGG